MDKEIYILWQGSDDEDYAGRVHEEIVGAFGGLEELSEYVKDSVLEQFTVGAECYIRVPGGGGVRGWFGNLCVV